MNKHYAGELAYWDTFAGLVPCKVLEVRKGGLIVRIRVTADRGPYRRGEKLQVRWYRVPPRNYIRTRNGVQHIEQQFEWCPEENNDGN